MMASPLTLHNVSSGVVTLHVWGLCPWFIDLFPLVLPSPSRRNGC